MRRVPTTPADPTLVVCQRDTMAATTVEVMAAPAVVHRAIAARLVARVVGPVIVRQAIAALAVASSVATAIHRNATQNSEKEPGIDAGMTSSLMKTTTNGRIAEEIETHWMMI